MAILGFLLLIAVVLVVVAALFGGGASVSVDLGWSTLNTNASVVFFAGVATSFIFLIAVWLMLRGAKRSRRRRSEIRALRERAESGERTRSERDAAPSKPPTPPSETGPDEHFDTTPRDT